MTPSVYTPDLEDTRVQSSQNNSSWWSNIRHMPFGKDGLLRPACLFDVLWWIHNPVCLQSSAGREFNYWWDEVLPGTSGYNKLRFLLNHMQYQPTLQIWLILKVVSNSFWWGRNVAELCKVILKASHKTLCLYSEYHFCI